MLGGRSDTTLNNNTVIDNVAMMHLNDMGDLVGEDKLLITDATKTQLKLDSDWQYQSQTDRLFISFNGFKSRICSQTLFKINRG